MHRAMRRPARRNCHVAAIGTAHALAVGARSRECAVARGPVLGAGRGADGVTMARSPRGLRTPLDRLADRLENRRDRPAEEHEHDDRESADSDEDQAVLDDALADLLRPPLPEHSAGRHRSGSALPVGVRGGLGVGRREVDRDPELAAVADELGLDRRPSPPAAGSRATRRPAGRRSPATRAVSAAASACVAPLVDHRRQRRRQVLCLAASDRPSPRAASGLDLGELAVGLLDRARPVAARRDVTLDAAPSDQSSRIATRSGTAPRYAASASSRIRKRPLSSSIGSRRSVPIDSNSTGTPARRPRSRAARRSVGTSPRSSRTIGRTSKMNDFVASSVCWTIATSWRTSPLAPSRVAADEPLDDLGLEDDVRQALGRAVVHRPGDLAAEVLLGAQDDPGDAGRRHVAPQRRRHRRPAHRPRPRAPRRPRRRRRGRRQARRPIAEPGQRLALALEDVDLGSP